MMRALGAAQAPVKVKRRPKPNEGRHPGREPMREGPTRREPGSSDKPKQISLSIV